MIRAEHSMLCNNSSYGTASTLRDEALLIVRSTSAATLQRLQRLSELLRAYGDGDGLRPSPRIECLLQSVKFTSGLAAFLPSVFTNIHTAVICG